MDRFVPSSSDRSRSAAPGHSQFVPPAETAEDLLKSQTVGLVHLDDFRKRRAEAMEQKERGSSGASTPQEGAGTPKAASKKKRKVTAKAKISFDIEGEDDDAESNASRTSTPTDSAAVKSKAGMKRLGANKSIGQAPRVMTKSALKREAEQEEIARQHFQVMREAVKATEIAIPFVFYDGSNTPGGRCRVRKGDHVWLFLDKARKVGAELALRGDKSRRDWARVSVDDLMLVRGEIILPHHYEFYYFLFNKVQGFNGLLFDYSASATKTTPAGDDENEADPSTFDPLARPDKSEGTSSIPDEDLEGFHEDPVLTKVVDRRWYERNKHIFPASVWEEYSPDKELSREKRKDTQGNTFFFS